MAQINWEEIEAAFSFRQVEDGEYTTQVTKAEVADTPSQSGNYAINFTLKEYNGMKFPYSSTHWLNLSDEKSNWRLYHMRSLLLDMGVSKEDAQKHVEVCENADDKAIAYRKMFNALAGKFPKAKVKVETQPYVYTYKEDDEAKGKKKGDKEIRLKGHRTEFAGESYMPPQTIDKLKERYPDIPVEGEKKVESVDDSGGEEIKMDEIPF